MANHWLELYLRSYTGNKAGAIKFGLGAIFANGSQIVSWEPLLLHSICGIILAPKLVPFLYSFWHLSRSYYFGILIRAKILAPAGAVLGTVE